MENINKTEIVKALKAKFDPRVIQHRAGPKKQVGNRWVEQKFSYVPTEHCIKRLDDTMPLSWSWSVVQHERVSFIRTKKWFDVKKQSEVSQEQNCDQVIVHGRLTLYFPDGPISQDAFGGSEITSGSGQAGDQYKIAASNALRKACYQFGIGAYLGFEDYDVSAADEAKPKVTQPPYAVQRPQTKAVNADTAPIKQPSNSQAKPGGKYTRQRSA